MTENRPIGTAPLWSHGGCGTVFCVLKTDPGGEIAGALSPGKISVHGDDDLTEAEPPSPDGSCTDSDKKDGKTNEVGCITNVLSRWCGSVSLESKRNESRILYSLKVCRVGRRFL